MAVTVALELPQPLHTMPMGRAYGGFVGLEDVAGTRWAISGIRRERHRPATPFNRIEQEETVPVT